MVNLVNLTRLYKLMEKWINQTLTTCLVVIFRSLFEEELLYTNSLKKFFKNIGDHLYLFIFSTTFYLFP